MSDKAIEKRLKMLREEIDTVLQAVRDNNPELVLTLENCTYDSGNSFRFKLTGTLPGGKSKDAQDYEMLAEMLALPTHVNDYTGADGKPDFSVPPKTTKVPGIKLPPLGATLTINGEKAVIVGGRPRAKFDIIVRILRTGKLTCYKHDAIAKAWANQQGAKP